MTRTTRTLDVRVRGEVSTPEENASLRGRVLRFEEVSSNSHDARVAQGLYWDAILFPILPVNAPRKLQTPSAHPSLSAAAFKKKKEDNARMFNGADLPRQRRMEGGNQAGKDSRDEPKRASCKSRA